MHRGEQRPEWTWAMPWGRNSRPLDATSALPADIYHRLAGWLTGQTHTVWHCPAYYSIPAEDSEAPGQCIELITGFVMADATLECGNGQGQVGCGYNPNP